MAHDFPRSDLPSRLAAALSVVLPGLGQAYRGRLLRQTAATVSAFFLLLGCTIALGQIQDRAAEIFFFMIVVLPWWILQSYDAYLPHQPDRGGIFRTLKVVWTRGHDVRYLGALFLLSAFMDVYIILANPSYALPVFCTRPEGTLGFLAKAQSPTLHTLIGYGFLRLRAWSLVVYLAYAAFGLLNATVNFSCFGFGRIRVTVVITLLAFTAYLLWRRGVFFRFRDLTPSRSSGNVEPGVNS